MEKNNMKELDVNNISSGDTLYSFYNDTLNVYKVKYICMLNDAWVLTCENINDSNSDFKDIHNFPNNEEWNMLSDTIWGAWDKLNESINKRIKKLNGLRGNLKGEKRRYMIEHNMVNKDHFLPHWKKEGFNSLQEYNEWYDDFCDDVRHNRI